MSIDTLMREGLPMIERQLPELDVAAAYDVVTTELPPRSRRRSPTWPRLAVAGVAAALAVAGLVVWLHHSQPPAAERPAPTPSTVLVEAPDGSPLNPDPGKGMEMLEVSSGDYQAYRPAPEQDATYSAWSPDGQQIASAVPASHGNGAGLWISDGAASRRQVYSCSDCTVRGLDWSPDGGRLTFSVAQTDGTSSLRVLTLSTGQAQDFPMGRQAVTSPRWSPDGAQISYVVTRGRHGDLDVIQPGLGSSSAHRVVGPIRGLESASWSPDGTQLAYTAGSPSLRTGTSANLYVVNADGTGVHRITQETSGTRLSDVEWEKHGTPFLVSAAFGSEPRPVGILALVSEDGHLQPAGGTGIIPGIHPRLRPVVTTQPAQ